MTSYSDKETKSRLHWIRRLATVRVRSYILIAFLAPVLILTVLAKIHNFHCDQRIRATRAELSTLKAWIADFHAREERLPNSIRELRIYVQEDLEDSSLDRIYVDFEKEKQTQISEHRTVNGSGGYFYDPNTGDIKVNLSEPVKSYFSLYYGQFRNEVPSNW